MSPNTSLQNRRQRVCIKGRVSNWIAVCSRVPQSFALDLYNFDVYMNDLQHEISSNVFNFLKVFRWYQEF